MKTLINLLLVHMTLISALSAMKISVSTANFQNSGSNYVEIYSKFKMDGLQWAVDSLDNSVYSQVEMLCLLSQEERILMAEKYKIQSPDTKSPKDYWDMKRFSLEPGEYALKIQYVDLNDLSDTLIHEQILSVEQKEDQFWISDILLFSEVAGMDSELAFKRSNFSYEPLEFNIVDPSNSNMIFYTEMYDLDKMDEDVLLIKYYVENLDDQNLESYSDPGYKKIEKAEFTPFLVDFSVEEMLSGNYMLHLELQDRSKKKLAFRSLRFAIYNPIQDFKSRFNPDALFEESFFQFLTEDELNYSLKAIYPRLENHMTEILNYIVSKDDLEPKRYFLYNFWSGFSIENMKRNYDDYMKVAKAVDNTYGSNVGFGFETHRGYYFLKYGKPDNIIYEEDEPTAPPYEIWIYNYVAETQQTNVKFLFYNPSLASNDFILLHSTCRGERNNPRWELDLYSDAYIEQPGSYIDGRQMPDNFHRNARRYFTDF